MKKKIIITAIIITLLAVLGIIFLTTNDKKESAPKELNVSYNDTNNIVVKGVKDGWTTVKEIEIENITNHEITYDLVWKDLVNTYKKQSDLLYEIESTGDGTIKLETSQLPVVSSNIFTSIKIKGNEKHFYKVKVWYEKTGEKEENSEFNGSLEVKVKK